MKRKKVAKNLFGEYVLHWYVVLIGILLIFPSYALLPLVLSFCMAKGINAFWSGIISIAAPMLILNIKLALRKKPYALAVQFVLFDVLGTAFYVINRVIMN